MATEIDVPRKNNIPTDPPNVGPRERDIIKYVPPAVTLPFVAIALIDIAVQML